MSVNWNDANEFESGLIIDGFVHIGNDNSEGEYKDNELPLVRFRSFPSSYFKVEINRENKISENHQHINIDGFEIEGQLTIEGQLVI